MLHIYDKINEILHATCWFMSQGLGPLAGGHQTAVFTAMLMLLILLGGPMLIRGSERIRRALLALPLYWIAIAAGAGIFSSLSGGRHLNDMIAYPMWLFLLAYIGWSLWLVVRHKGYRFITGVFAAANAYVAFFTTFIGGMAVTGSWI